MNQNTKQYGSFTITSSKTFRASTYTTITMTYKVGSAGVAVGGMVKFALPNMGWSEPLTPYARRCPDIHDAGKRLIARWSPCNTTYKIKSKTGSDVYLSHRASQNSIGPYNNWTWWINAAVELAPLEEGDEIVITYGDKSFGEKGAFVQPWKEKGRVWFAAFVDSVGSGNFVQVPGSPVNCSVVPGPLERCIATIPSVINTGKIPVKLSLTDWGMDAVTDKQWEKVKIEIADSKGKEIKPEKDLFTNGSLDSFQAELKANNLPITIEVIQSQEKVINAQSNPSIKRNDRLNLYWGDLHCHSFYHQYNEKLGYGDACTSPDELLKYAREVTHLDFAAITDGRGALPDNAGWRESQEAVINNHQDGFFVALKGWEIQFGEDGHRNAIYRDAIIEPHINDPAFSQASIWSNAGKYGMKAALKYYKNREDVLLIPHHPMVWMNWDVHDPNLDRLVEIYSCWGSSEYEHNDLWDKTSLPKLSVQYALSKGYKLGFVAGSDSHTGYIGRSISNADRYKFCSYKAGFTAVYAEELTRGAIFEALKHRSCYATTGARMIIDFSVNDHFMGTISKDERSSNVVEFNIAGTDKIGLVEIIRDNQTVYRIEPLKDFIQDQWIDNSVQAQHAEYYYLRVTQVDGNKGWASPVWV